MGLINIRRSPDFLKQLPLTNQPPWMTNQCLQKLPLGRGQMNLSARLIGLTDQMIIEIDPPPSNLYGLHQPWLGGASGDSADSRQQFLNTEGLCDVVIRARVKGIHLGRAVHTPREDHDRHMGPGPKRADDVHTL